MKFLAVPIVALVAVGCAARLAPTGDKKIVVDTYSTNSAYLDGYFAGYYSACIDLSIEAKKRTPGVQEVGTPTLLTIRQVCRESVYGWINQQTGGYDETLEY